MLVIAILCLLNGSGNKNEHHIEVDVIEINHVFNEDCELSFTQAIYWRWYGNRLSVDHWRRVPDEYHVTKLPSVNDEWMSYGTMIVVKGKSFRETWTMYDPEIEDRKFRKAEVRVWILPKYPSFVEIF